MLTEPTMNFRWRKATTEDNLEHLIIQAFKDFYVLEQQWKDLETGELTWQPIEIKTP